MVRMLAPFLRGRPRVRDSSWLSGPARARCGAARRRGRRQPEPLRHAAHRPVRPSLDVHPEPGEGLADQARDLHLGDADAIGDLGLRHVLFEAQPQHLAVPGAEHAERAVEQRAHLGAVELGVVVAEGVREAHVLAGRLLERAGAPCARGLDRREHLLEGRVDGVGELLDGRRAAELVRELVALLGDLELQLLEAARDAHRPRLVAEVALDLAEDGRRRVGREAHLAGDVEAVDRLHDPDARDLDEVVERLPAAGVAAGERPGEREHLLGELVAGPHVTVLVDAAQELLLARGTGSTGDGLVVRPPVHRASLLAFWRQDSRRRMTRSRCGVPSAGSTTLSSAIHPCRPSSSIVATWLSNHGPSSTVHVTGSSGTPAARASAAPTRAAGRDIAARMPWRSWLSSGLRSGEHTAW